MFARISNSWELVKASWQVLVADKELVLFPIVSLIASIIVLITFAIPTFMAGLFDDVTGVPFLGYVIGFFFYTTMYTVAIFSNAALVGAATIRLKGGDPTVGDGFRIAFEHFNTILGYAVVSATVGMILRAISERGGIIGQIVSSLVGFAWSVATFLTIPVLVLEDVGPIDAVKRSASLLKKTWGEQIVGNLSIGTIFGLLMFLTIIVGIGSTIAAAMISGALAVSMVFLFVLIILALSMVSAALNGIYTAAVYQYATTGDSIGYFDADLIKSTFRHKKQR